MTDSRPVSVVITRAEWDEIFMALMNKFHYTADGNTTNPTAKSAYDKVNEIRCALPERIHR